MLKLLLVALLVVGCTSSAPSTTASVDAPVVTNGTIAALSARVTLQPTVTCLVDVERAMVVATDDAPAVIGVRFASSEDANDSTGTWFFPAVELDGDGVGELLFDNVAYQKAIDGGAATESANASISAWFLPCLSTVRPL